MRGVGHGGCGASGAGRVLPAGGELNFRFKLWRLATCDHLFVPLTDKRHKLNCLRNSLDVKMSSRFVHIYVCISNWFIVYWYKSIIGLNWKLNNCWFCIPDLLSSLLFSLMLYRISSMSPVKRWRGHDFCKDFKFEINKVDEQRRFFITKGNDAGLIRLTLHQILCDLPTAGTIRNVRPFVWKTIRDHYPCASALVHRSRCKSYF